MSKKGGCKECAMTVYDEDGLRLTKGTSNIIEANLNSRALIRTITRDVSFIHCCL